MVRVEEQWEVPAGFDAKGRMITLDQVVSEEPAPVAAEALTREQRAALVRARWEAGEWDDVFFGPELIDLPRAVRELEAETETGETLLELSEGALEMVIEDARRARGLG